MSSMSSTWALMSFLQRTSANKDELKDLIEGTLEIVTVVNEAVTGSQARQSAAQSASGDGFRKTCEELEQYVQMVELSSRF